MPSAPLCLGTLPCDMQALRLRTLMPSAPLCLSTLPCDMQALRLRTPMPRHIALRHASFAPSAPLCLGTLPCDMQALRLRTLMPSAPLCLGTLPCNKLCVFDPLCLRPTPLAPHASTSTSPCVPKRFTLAPSSSAQASDLRHLAPQTKLSTFGT
jgi:hypothetical protein